MQKLRNSDINDWRNLRENSLNSKLRQKLEKNLEKNIKDNKNKFSKLHIENILSLIDLPNISDAKQLLFILKNFKGEISDFRYLSDNDIVLYLNNIICSYSDPLPKLIQAFDDKDLQFLPTKIHEWLLEDLSNVLFFVHDLKVNEIMNGAFVNGEEITNALTNFLLFNVIEYDKESNNYFIDPIEKIQDRDRSHFISQFERYKKWYLKEVELRDSYRWLNALDENRLDNIIADLKKKDLMILTDVFYPKSVEDKISLIIACLNKIPKEGIFDIVNKFDNADIKGEVFIVQRGKYDVREYYGHYIIKDSESLLDYDYEKYEGFEIIDSEDCDSVVGDELVIGNKIIILDELVKDVTGRLNLKFRPLSKGRHEIKLIAKRTEKYSLLARNMFIAQVKNANRQQRIRDKNTPSDDERTINLTKKDWAIIKKVSEAANMKVDEFLSCVIKLSNKAYEDKYPFK